MADDKLSGKAGLDTTDFKTGIAEMNRQLRVLESGFRASAAALGDWTEDADGLELRIKSLNAQLDIQRQKVAATRAEYERIKNEKGETSRAAQELEIKLNKETESLGKMENELRDTSSSLDKMRNSSGEAGQEVDQLGNKTDRTNNKMQTFQSILKGVGATIKAALVLIAAMTLAIVGVTTAVSGLVFSAASAGSEIQDMADKTGISTQRLQEMKFIGDQVGTSLDTITGANSRLIRSMFGAKDGTGAQADAFKELGVRVTDADGRLRDSQSVFNQTIDALGKVRNPAEADALAMEIFGKSAQELNPLIKLGSQGMAAMAQQGRDLGAVMSDETVAALDKFDDLLSGLKDGLKGTLGTLAGVFLPGFQSAFEALGGYLKEFSAIVKNSNGDIGKIFEGVGGLVVKIVQDIASQAPRFLETGVTILKSIVQSILSVLPILSPIAINVILTFLQFLFDSAPLLLDAGLKAIITLAQGLTSALPSLIPAIVQAIITIVNVLLANAPLLISAALQLILALEKGLLIALPILLAALPQIIQSILDILVDAAPELTAAGGQMIGMLVIGILAAGPYLLGAIDELIVRLGVTLVRWVKSMPEIGKGLLAGIWKGIADNAGEFMSNIGKFFETMIANIKNQLQMHSPSGRLEDEIGINMLPGVTNGVTKTLPRARQVMEQAIATLTNNLRLNVPGVGVGAPQLATVGAAGAGAINRTNNQNITINIAATVRNQQDIDYLAQEVARRIAS